MGDIFELKSGISIEIRRTDGRTHPAIISRVNYESKSVSVEWFEKGETKGKEIEFDSVFSLNRHIRKSDSNHNLIKNNNLVVRSSSKTSLPTVLTKNCLVNNNNPRNMLSATSGENLRRSYLAIEKNKGIDNFSQRIVSSRATSVNSNIPESLSSIRRRSNVVKEIEKLKKNREERRVRQAEKKEEKEALMNMESGNPHWHFSSMIKEYRSNLEIKPLTDADPVKHNQITVCVRKRPLNKKEVMRKEVDVITVPRKDLILVHEPKQKVDLTKYLENQEFRFDYAFDELCTNELVYKYTTKPLIETVFEGGMATCFAYGQTGSGKTHTMGGIYSGKTQDCKKGIYALAAMDVFRYANMPQYKNKNIILTASFFEIYSGKVFDLLAGKIMLRVLEDGKQHVQIIRLTEKVVNSVDEVLNLIQIGNQARTSGQTAANTNSSRSHAVFQITLRLRSLHQVYGKLSLIDLAGNERGADTMSSDRSTRMEGAQINKSLLALKECIRALGKKGAHLPFRGSKLTQVLKDSFIGENNKTCMIAMISPGMSSCEHSLNTLRYADRVKELSLNDTTDEEYVEAIPEEIQEESDGGLGDQPEEIMTDEDIIQSNVIEEEMLEMLKTWRQCCAEFDQKEKELYQQTFNENYNRDSFATELGKVLNSRHELLNNLIEKVVQFKQANTA